MIELKPIDESCKRVWEWRNNVKYTGSIEDLWKWFNNQKEPNIMIYRGEIIRSDNSHRLIYKTMLYSKLQEIADDLYEELKRKEKND